MFIALLDLGDRSIYSIPLHDINLEMATCFILFRPLPTLEVLTSRSPKFYPRYNVKQLRGLVFVCKYKQH